MKTAKLTAILLAGAIILLLAVPQLRGTLDLLRYNPMGIHGTWLRKAEVERVATQHPEDAEMWLAFAEYGMTTAKGKRGTIHKSLPSERGATIHVRCQPAQTVTRIPLPT